MTRFIVAVIFVLVVFAIASFAKEVGTVVPGTNIRQLFNVEDIQAFVDENEVEPAVIGYFDETTNAADKKVFDQVADADSFNYRFAFITNKEVLDHLKFEGCAVTVHKPKMFVDEKKEKAKSRYTAKTLKTESLRNFIFDKSLPLVGELNFKSRDRYEKVKIPTLTAFIDVDHEKNEQYFQYISNRMRKVAEQFKGKIVFNIASKHSFGFMLDNYGLGPLLDPKDIGIGIHSGRFRYHMKKPFNVENLKEFVEKFFDGQLIGQEEIIDTNPPPSPEQASTDSFNEYVTQITDENIDEMLINTEKDVFIDFYAPWCGHCKRLKPEMNKLAEQYKNDNGVTIAAMDVTAHKVPSGFHVQSYPTLYFIKANAKKLPLFYQQERSASEMARFVKTHRST